MPEFHKAQQVAGWPGMAKVVCSLADSCPEPMCGGKEPHWWEPRECGHCPKNTAAICLDVPQPAKPKVICLCGSTRFTGQMLVHQWKFTKKGWIVLSWCALPDWYFTGDDKAHIGDQEGVKELVDEIHKRKIDLSDEVFVLNIGGYIGQSTRSEIDYALAHGKPVLYLEALP